MTGNLLCKSAMTDNSENFFSRFELHPLLLLVVLLSTFLFFISAWSPPFVYDSLSEWYGSWQQIMLSFVCHQQLDRTLILQDIPLAACYRCIGIYSGLFAGLLFYTFSPDFIKKSEHYILRIFLALTFVVLLDGGANLIQIWQSTAEYRLIIGGGWGVSMSAVLVSTLIIKRSH